MIVVCVDKSRDSNLFKSGTSDLVVGETYECIDWELDNLFISLRDSSYLYYRSCFKPLEEIREDKINTILK